MPHNEVPKRHDLSIFGMWLPSSTRVNLLLSAFKPVYNDAKTSKGRKYPSPLFIFNDIRKHTIILKVADQYDAFEKEVALNGAS